MNNGFFHSAAEGEGWKSGTEEDENPADLHDKVSMEIIGNLAENWSGAGAIAGFCGRGT
jgi:hypothetical protein